MSTVVPPEFTPQAVDMHLMPSIEGFSPEMKVAMMVVAAFQRVREFDWRHPFQRSELDARLDTDLKPLLHSTYQWVLSAHDIGFVHRGLAGLTVSGLLLRPLNQVSYTPTKKFVAMLYQAQQAA